MALSRDEWLTNIRLRFFFHMHLSQPQGVQITVLITLQCSRADIVISPHEWSCHGRHVNTSRRSPTALNSFASGWPTMREEHQRMR